MAAVEALRQAQDGGQGANGSPALPAEVGVAVVVTVGRRPPVIARDERDGVDLVGLEAAQVAVLDQVVRVLVVALVADVDADVVEQRGVFQPLALAIGEPVNAARLVEERRSRAARPGWRARASSCSAPPARSRCGAGRRDSDRPARSACGGGRCSRGPALRAATNRTASARWRRGGAGSRRAGSTPAAARSARRGSSPGTRSRCSSGQRDELLADAAQLLRRDAAVAQRAAGRASRLRPTRRRRG